MASLSSIIDSVHPTISGTNVIIGDTVWVLFDREIDQSSVENGNFFITGPDFDSWSGPDLALFEGSPQAGDEDNILTSPGLHGVVKGTYSFETYNLTTFAEISGVDTTGSGHLFRTRAIFTPSKALAPNITYHVHLSGEEDETDSFVTGITSRTVFDTVTVNGTNNGSKPTFYGGYRGTAASDTFHVKITIEGEVGTAKFIWWTAGNPSVIHGPLFTKRSNILLDDGVYVSFQEGIYRVNNEYTSIVKEPTVFTGNYIWPFQTGSGSIVDTPTDISTSVIGDPVTVDGSTTTTAASATTFKVSSTYPADQATNLDILNADFTIDVTFNSTVLSSSVSADRVGIVTEPVNGDVNDGTILYSGVVTNATIVASGTHLLVTVPSGMFKSNNVVTVTLDSLLSNSSSVTLGSDYSFYFSTKYDPLYSSVRRLRLDYGAFLTSVPDDTINLAIFEASKEADHLAVATPADTNYFTFVRRQWTTCKAAEILLTNTAGGSGGGFLKSKTLGDLSVEYNVNATNNAIDRALGCLAKWTPNLIGGGVAVQTPVMAIKGDLDPDRPAVGRLWQDLYLNNTRTVMPSANSKSKATTSRRWRSGYYNRWGK